MAAENQLIMLESEISRELEVITDQLRQKYVLFVPLPAHQWSEVHRRFKYLVQNVEDRLKVAEKMLSDVEKEHDPKHVSVLRTRLDDVETCKALIGRLTEVEGNLVQLTNGCGSLLESARLIISCKQILADVNRTADISELVGRASGLMSRELATHAGIVRSHLADFLRSSVVFELGVLAARQDGPKKATGTPSVNTLRINFGLPSDATTNLSALALLGDAEARLTKWAEQLVAGFVEPLLAHDDVKGFQREVNIIKSTEKTYTLRVKPAPGRENVCPTTTTDPATIAATFKTLVEMFTYLKSDLGEISVAGVSLVAALGEKLENPIKQLLLKHILLPVSSDETKLSEMLKSTEAFRGELVKLGWWAPGGEAMKAFAESHASSFVDRKCLGIITRGRELVCKNYIELATVGADVKDGDETVDEFREAFLLRPGADPSDDDAYPQLMRLLKCSVSKSTVDFVDLLMSTLREAAETENEMLGARLGQTATNLVRLFVVLAPKHHKEAISTVPQIAAVFYNNCYYLAHRLLVLPFDIFNSPRAKEKNVELLRPAFICLVPELREEAARALERVLVQCRRQISAILTDDSLFVGLDDSSRLQKCDKTLNGCVKQLQTLASVWREVLTETVFCRALGNVASYFLAQLNELVLSKEDTRASDADATALQLERMLDQLKPLFEIRGHTMIHKFCEHAFFRTKELVLCLNGSLQTVDDRWCDGKGPLAQWLTPKEIRGLVRSLFANTEARKRVLERI